MLIFNILDLFHNFVRTNLQNYENKTTIDKFLIGR